MQIFIRGNPFLGDGFRSEPWLLVIKQLQSQNLLSGLVLYGSPYLWEEVVGVLGSSIPAAYSPGQMPEAQRQVLEALFKVEEDRNDLVNSMQEEFTN